jgi:hypothetical protein
MLGTKVGVTFHFHLLLWLCHSIFKFATIQDSRFPSPASSAERRTQDASSFWLLAIGHFEIYILTIFSQNLNESVDSLELSCDPEIEIQVGMDQEFMHAEQNILCRDDDDSKKTEHGPNLDASLLESSLLRATRSVPKIKPAATRKAVNSKRSKLYLWMSNFISTIRTINLLTFAEKPRSETTPGLVLAPEKATLSREKNTAEDPFAADGLRQDENNTVSRDDLTDALSQQNDSDQIGNYLAYVFQGVKNCRCLLHPHFICN